MITIWKEIKCDNCGNADYYRGSNESVNEQAKDNGWIVRKKKHYCNTQCERNGNTKTKTETSKR